MGSMFEGALVFNQNISNWDTSSVINMKHMFLNAKAFNQNLQAWDTAAVINMHNQSPDKESSYQKNQTHL